MQASSRHDDTSLDEILHPPGYRPRWLHFALVFTELVGRIPPLKLSPALLAMVAIASWPWADLRIPAATMSLALLLFDGVGLTLLPHLGRSFGPVSPPLLALTLVRTGITFSSGLIWSSPAALSAIVAVQLGMGVAAFYATWIEPFRIGVTRQDLQSRKLAGAAPLRLLHISDLHVEGITAREHKLLDLVECLAPDLIVLTGDYLNLSSVRDAHAQAEARDLLAALCERSRRARGRAVPVCAITGSPPVDLSDVVPAIFEGLPIVWLLDEVAQFEAEGCSISIVGLRCTRERTRDVRRLRDVLANVPEGRFVLLLYHSPDLMPEATECGVDLYLCGHTHGGQIRLPLLGAVITSSAFWKRYEMGRYEENSTTLYVSRGLGMEGLGAPRARLLSPPEIIEWTLTGGADPRVASEVRRASQRAAETARSGA